jgi:hypothetical protein
MNSLIIKLLVVALIFFMSLAIPAFPAAAAVSLDVRIGPPQPYRFAAPPQVVVIPGTYVYVVPDIDADIFFFSGYWYRPSGGHWFRATSYNGPWVYCPDPSVPAALVQLPPDYHSAPVGYRRIPYADLRRNWRMWDRDRYWDRDRDWNEGWHGRGEGRREERRDRFDGRSHEGRDFERGEHGHDRH